MRIVATIAQLTATGDEQGIQLHQLITGSVSDGGAHAIDVESGVPFGDGIVRVTVTESDDAEWTLAIRIPDWSTSPTLSVCGDDQQAIAPDADGYVRVRRSWAEGDTVVMRTNPEFAIVAADPRIDAVRGERAIVRGPIVYCVEGDDLGDATIDAVRIPSEPRVRATTLDWLDVPGAEAELAFVPLPPVSGAPYSVQPSDEAPAAERSVPLVPYFAWGNRGATTMRVWLPQAATTTTPSSSK
jgi:DUF1680 family protein